MSFSPSFDAFVGLYDAGRAQVVSTTLVADLETPVSAMLKLGEGEANAFLLDSVEGGAVRALMLPALALARVENLKRFG